MPKIAAKTKTRGTVGTVSPKGTGKGGIVGEVEKFLRTYLVMNEDELFAVAAWTVSAYLVESFDRFPHLAVTSPEPRCGKTTVLKLLKLITPKAILTTNISQAALYRIIEKEKPTLLFDEAQSMHRRGNESSEVLRELFNAGIDRDSVTHRCVSNGDDHDVAEFAIYCPKALALIGDLDPVLADRCVLVRMKRKASEDDVAKFRNRKVEPVAKALSERIGAWAEKNQKRVEKFYDEEEELELDNDRMAQLFHPLRAIVTTDDPKNVEALERCAAKRDRETADSVSEGVVLLRATREIFAKRSADDRGRKFLSTQLLIQKLTKREEEPWDRYSHGAQITARRLSDLLAPYGITPDHGPDKKKRGYYAATFEDAWRRYLGE